MSLLLIINEELVWKDRYNSHDYYFLSYLSPKMFQLSLQTFSLNFKKMCVGC